MSGWSKKPCKDSLEEALDDDGQERITTEVYDYEYVPGRGDVYSNRTNTYNWDQGEGRYVLERTTLPPVDVGATSTPPPAPQSIYSSPRLAFFDGAYDTVLEMTPTTLDLAPADNPDRLLFAMYLRALSLQALEEDQQSLDLYVELQTIAPEHIIGMLAALHFEDVED